MNRNDCWLSTTSLYSMDPKSAFLQLPLSFSSNPPIVIQITWCCRIVHEPYLRWWWWALCQCEPLWIQRLYLMHIKLLWRNPLFPLKSSLNTQPSQTCLWTNPEWTHFGKEVFRTGKKSLRWKLMSCWLRAWVRRVPMLSTQRFQLPWCIKIIIYMTFLSISTDTRYYSNLIRPGRDDLWHMPNIEISHRPLTHLIPSWRVNQRRWVGVWRRQTPPSWQRWWKQWKKTGYKDVHCCCHGVGWCSPFTQHSISRYVNFF